MVQQWKTEAVLCDSNGQEKDWYEINPGPAMRGWLQGHRGALVKGMWSAFLRVTHLASGMGRCCDLTPAGKIAFSAKIDGGLVTLELAAKMMKKDLEATHDEMQRVNERGA